MTQSRLKELFRYDKNSGLFYWIKRTSNRIKVGDIAGNLSADGYIEIRLDKKLYKAHRLAWLYVYGALPMLNIDHINHNKTDNRIENLRDVTFQKNSQNTKMHKDNKSGKMGVHYSKRDNVWIAYISIKGKRKHLGSSKDKHTAIELRNCAEKKYCFHNNHGKI